MKNKMSNIKNVVIITIALILSIPMVSALPLTPEFYEGQAFLDGKPVLDDAVITVESFTDGELFGTAMLHPKVGPGFYDLNVSIDDFETPEREGAYPSEQLTWKINDLICDTPQEGFDIADPGKLNTNYTLNANSTFAITNFTPSSPVNDIEGATRTFSITINQNINVTWYLNGMVEKDNEKGVTQATYTNFTASIGTWNISAVATNNNSEAVQTWIWNVSGAGAPPVIIFTDPTPADGAILTQNYTCINTSVSNSSTAFIDWNNSVAGWWRFNNESGENSTFFRDWSSWGNNVNCSGINCPTSTSGKFGNALRFNGSNDYIFTTSSTRIPDTSPFTIESWINVKNDSHWMDIIRNEGSWALKIGPNQEVGLEIAGKQDVLSNIVVPVNGWTHLAITFEKDTVNFYKDGILKDTKNETNVSDSGSNSIYIGGYSSGNTYFNGTMDEIKIHNRVLGPKEIKASYDAETNILSRNFTNLTYGIYHYKAYTQNLLGKVNQTQTKTVIVTSLSAPNITEFTPTPPVNDTQNQSRTFNITVDQIVNVTWYLNGVVVKDNETGVTQATYTNTSASTGIWNVIAAATNANGTVSKEWIWNVTYSQPDDWYDTNWKYRKAIEINNVKDNLYDHQICLIIDTQSLISSGKLNSDGSDLRFVDSDNNVLSFWNEDEFNSLDTTFWVKVPIINNTNKTTTYMYYGNPTAEIVVDGDETFEFFETNFITPLDHSASYLNTPTYDGSGQAIHPDIYYNPGGWNGYSYWMVMTPYPDGDANYENPSILVSNDGLSWIVPAGLTNPIDPTPGAGSNSDTEIVYNENLDRLEVYYVESGAGTSYLKRRTSTDGIAWSNEEDIFNLPDYQVMSPAIIKDGPTYHMWYNDADSCSALINYVRYRTSSDGVTWSAPQDVNINQPGQNIWHSEVQFIPSKNEYWMIYAAYPVGSNCGDTELYFASSTDKINWVTYGDTILGKGFSWDSGEIYRATFLYDNNTDNLRVWYSARSNGGAWHTGYTQRQYSDFADGLRWSRNSNSGSSTTNPRDGNYGLMQVGGMPYPVHELSMLSDSIGSYSYTVWYKDELSTNSNYQATLNLHHEGTWSNVGVYTDASSNNYVRAISGSYTDTGITRTLGWHKFEIRATDTGMYFIIDGVDAGSTTSITSSTNVTPGIEGYLTGIAYFDDYYIRKYAYPEPTYILGEEELQSALSISINSWNNNKTNNESSVLTINISEPVTFNATANQTITTWNWHKDDINQNNDFDNFTTSWSFVGTKTIKVNAINNNGSSNTIVWTVNVVSNSSPGGLTAHWKFDENTGNTVLDSSGNDNAGVVYGPTWTTGQIGSALMFDGVDDYIDIGSTLNFEEGFTILMWAKRDSGNTWRTLISKGESDLEKDHNYVIYLSPTNTIEFAIGDGINYRNFETTDSYDTNWHHLVVEFVSSTDMRIYVDGVLQSGTYNLNGKATIPVANSKKTLIGASNTTTEFFKGVIDEVKFYNRVLTEGEIIADYSGSSPSMIPSIISFNPLSPINGTDGQSRTFGITVDQTVGVTWYLNGVVVKDNEKGVTQATYTNIDASTGTWNVNAIATNANGTISQEWTWNVISQSPSNDSPSNDSPSNDSPSNDSSSNDSPSNDLSAHWKLDESTSTMVSDSSGNGNTGSVYGPIWTTGKIGSALQFDGASDYVDVGNTLNFEEGFTILMWAKRDAGSSAWQTLISKGESTNDNSHNYVLYFNPTNCLEFSFGDGTNYRSFETTNSYDTNWHHLAVEFVSSTDMRIYVDGVMQSGMYDPNGKAITPAANSKETLIGASSTTTEFFKGIIDEIKIYNRVLTEEEIMLDYSEKNKY